MLKKLLVLSLVAISASAFVTGCKEKTTSEKVTEAVEAAKKDMGAAQKEGEKKVEEAKESLGGAMEALKK